MDLVTTINKIYKKRPCSEGFAKLLNGLFAMQIHEDTRIVDQFRTLTEAQQKQEVSLSQVLSINGVKDAFWVLRCWGYDDYCLLNVNIAESVLPIFEKKRPNDNRPRETIEAVRKYKKGVIDKEELNAYAADAAAYAADAAAYAAAAAAYADAAAYAAADAAADAAAYAAADAAAAAYAAADAAADAAAYAAARQEQWDKNEKMMREFIKTAQ